jgi:FHS family L-fucose permease-like MFS transporter
MVGRFIGAAVLRRFPPPLVLAAVAFGAITLIAISVSTSGALSGYTLIAVGLMNAIMFPTIFTLACAGLGKRAPEGSGLICVAIVGGAIIPPILGLAADAGGLRLGLAVPVLCYLGIALFARHCWRNPVAA